jgi:hypothetical protein
MDPVPAAFVTGAVATLGRWSKGKPIDIRLVVGIVFMAIMLAGLAQINRPLSRSFGVLVVVSTLLVYGRDIVKKAGLTK